MDRINLAQDVGLSRIVYGMKRLSGPDETSASQIQARIEACLEQGVTTLEQSTVYAGGEGPRLLGDALRAAPQLSERVEIALKVGKRAADGMSRSRLNFSDLSAESVSAAVEAALRDLGRERLELLILDGPDPLLEPERLGEAVDRLVAAGKIAAVGVAHFSSPDIDLLQSRMETPLRAASQKLGVMASKPISDGRLAHLRRRRIRPLATDVFSGGQLFDDFAGVLRARLGMIGAPYGVDFSIAAVAWLLRHPAGIVPVVDMIRVERIRALGVAPRIEIDAESWIEIFAAGSSRKFM